MSQRDWTQRQWLAYCVVAVVAIVLAILGIVLLDDHPTVARVCTYAAVAGVFVQLAASFWPSRR